MYAANYDGLKKRETYNEIVEYLQYGQEKIKYPDRSETVERESSAIEFTGRQWFELFGRGDSATKRYEKSTGRTYAKRQGEKIKILCTAFERES